MSIAVDSGPGFQLMFNRTDTNILPKKKKKTRARYSWHQLSTGGFNYLVTRIPYNIHKAIHFQALICIFA